MEHHVLHSASLVLGRHGELIVEIPGQDEPDGALMFVEIEQG
jgi:hypothetical protein